MKGSRVVSEGVFPSCPAGKAGEPVMSPTPVSQICAMSFPLINRDVKCSTLKIVPLTPAATSFACAPTRLEAFCDLRTSSSDRRDMPKHKPERLP